MAYRTGSDWSRNKKTNDLVYTFTDGSSKVYRKIDDQIYEITTTEEDGMSTRLVIDTEMTVEQFDFFKTWSDENYHITGNEEAYENKGKVDYDDVANTLQASVPITKEPEYNPQPYRTRENALLIWKSLSLTPTQRRQYLKSYRGKNYRDIAAEESTSHTAVKKSVQAAKKKIEKKRKSFLEKS